LIATFYGIEINVEGYAMLNWKR